MYDYANILFSGRCNLDCYGCIKNRIKGYRPNLGSFPLKGIDGLIKEVNRWRIPDLAFTAIGTDLCFIGTMTDLYPTLTSEPKPCYLSALMGS